MARVVQVTTKGAKAPQIKSFTQNSQNMKKRVYINPAIIRAAMVELEKYITENPQSKTPLFDVANDQPETSRAAYVRAAQRLKWNVTRTRGHVYENGYFLW